MRSVTPPLPCEQLPKFVQHAGEEARECLQRFYACALPPARSGDVLDLCSSWTSHYPDGWKGRRVACLGLNPLELLANPSKTEWKVRIPPRGRGLRGRRPSALRRLQVQDLNTSPTLPYESDSFDVITNSLSVDYVTRPLELFKEMHRVLKPGGIACMAFTNRCFPTKVRQMNHLNQIIPTHATNRPALIPHTRSTAHLQVVPIWTRPFDDGHHAQIVGAYFKYSAEWADVGVADVSPDGWVGQRDPMIVVVGRK